jgi:MarR family transcriptional regulator for hemolysin
MENFSFEVAETARLIRREANRRAAVLGATKAQWRVLARLSRAGDALRQIELAEALDIEPITLCRMIDRLAEAGLVERCADEVDRRAWRIHLTAKAGPLIETLRGIADTFLADALSGIGDAEQARVRGVLARVRANIAGRTATRRAS